MLTVYSITCMDQRGKINATLKSNQGIMKNNMVTNLKVMLNTKNGNRRNINTKNRIMSHQTLILKPNVIYLTVNNSYLR